MERIFQKLSFYYIIFIIIIETILTIKTTATSVSCIARKDSDPLESCSHNYNWGNRSPHDVHLITQIITEKSKPMRVITKDVIYKPKVDEYLYGRTITQIILTDQYTNGNGGYATLKDGGPSTNFVFIQLKSQRGHGFNFTLDIYGL